MASDRQVLGLHVALLFVVKLLVGKNRLILELIYLFCPVFCFLYDLVAMKITQ